MCSKANDFRKQFSEWWRVEFVKSNVKFLEGGLVFDQYFNLETKSEWHEIRV